MSWIKAYLKYTQRHEAPSLFHMWVGLTLISAALGRKCYIQKGYYTLYPNLFTVLVAGSARCKKSTAIDIGAKLFEDIDNVRVIGTSSGSREKFLRKLLPENLEIEEHFRSTLIFADELSVFLSKDMQGERLMNDLTVLFNNPKEYVYDTYSHGKLTIKEPYISILSGSQPSALEKILPDLAVGSGFTSRILFIYQADTEKERTDFQAPSSEEIELKVSLAKALKKISLLSGEFTLTQEALDYYLQWYKNIEESEDHRLDGFIARKHDHVLKVSMLLSACELKGFSIEKRHVEGGVLAIDMIQNLLPQALAGVGSVPTIKGTADKILRLLERYTRMSHSDLLRRCYGLVNASDFRQIIDTLISSNLIHRDPRNPSMLYFGGEKRQV